MSVENKRKYKGFILSENKGTKFGRPKFTKYGKEQDIQDYIDSGREDTEIYPTLAKYGTLKPLERSAQAIFGDFTEYNDLRTCFDKAKKSKQMWADLPMDIKNIFNNDVGEFIDRGMEWAKGEVEKQQKQKKEEKKPDTDNNTGNKGEE